jgi:hypothetical protein
MIYYNTPLASRYMSLSFASSSHSQLLIHSSGGAGGISRSHFFPQARSYHRCMASLGRFTIVITAPHVSRRRAHSSAVSSRPRSHFLCQSSLPPAGGGDGGGDEKKSSRWAATAERLYNDVVKAGMAARENLSPKQKGDWKDVTLMSFSFAVYVHISQKLVCTYCAWLSMINH